MLQNAYLLAKIGADTAENEQHFAEILPKIGNYPTGPRSRLWNALIPSWTRPGSPRRRRPRFSSPNRRDAAVLCREHDPVPAFAPAAKHAARCPDRSGRGPRAGRPIDILQQDMTISQEVGVCPWHVSQVVGKLNCRIQKNTLPGDTRRFVFGCVRFSFYARRDWRTIDFFFARIGRTILLKNSKRSGRLSATN